MSISIDPSAVLEELNELGYRNITAEQLKAFIIDLKRLIKHDLKQQDENTAPPSAIRCPKRRCSSNDPTPPATGKLPYQAPTQSFLQKCTFEKKTKRTPREEANPLPPVMVPSRLTSAAGRDAEKNNHKMWIRPPPLLPRTVKSDPVALFNNYQKDWSKFKGKIPVDNNRQDLRWAIRNRMSSAGRFE